MKIEGDRWPSANPPKLTMSCVSMPMHCCHWAPTAEWTAQQLREAFPWDSAPQYLLRDRDGIFGTDFTAQVKAMVFF
jgi:hypothetical protein